MSEDQRLFGTNGIRGEVNELLTSDLAVGIGRAIATYAISHGAKPADAIMLGTDTRYSGDMLKSAMSAGILSTGCQAVDAGVCTTPALQYGVKTTPAVMGVIITASHNPPKYNGIKCVAEDGTETNQSAEKEIEDIYRSKNFSIASWDNTLEVIEAKDTTMNHVNDIVKLVDRDLIASKSIKVILDCANGAATVSSPFIIEKLGARLTTLNGQPSGGFPGHPSEPTEDNLHDMKELLRNTDAEIGIAHDGDGDRAIFMDENGEFLFGDKSLAIVAKYIVEQNRGGKVVTAINTSSVLEDVVEAAGGEMIYTPIGSPIVARVMIDSGAVFGGEENGGLIFPKLQYCRDGGMTAASMLEIMAKTEKTLSQLADELPVYHLCKLKFDYPVQLREKILSKYLSQVEHTNPVTMDGVKVLDDNGWVLVRPSGTEAIYRIQVEDTDPVRARNKADATKKVLFDILEGLN